MICLDQPVAGAKNFDSSKQGESSFGEVDVAETEELAEHDPGEPWGNTDNTDHGVVWGCFHGGSFSLE